MSKRFCPIFTFLLVFGLGAVLIGDESETVQYFPDTLGSYWVYVDQDGNELTRRSIEGEEIAEKVYGAFSYEPDIEDWMDYDYHFYPNLYHIGEKQVAFLVGDEAEKAVEARFAKEMEAFLKIAAQMTTPDENIDIHYDIEVEIQDSFYVLPMPITFNEKWDATQIKAKLTMRADPPQDPGDIAFDFTITEVGKVISTENVETPAGTFENCLKIEYRTHTSVVLSPNDAGDEDMNPPGESVTTLWVAPNVGIVKSHQKAEDIFLNVIPLPGITTSTTVKTLELKKYEIKSAESERGGSD